MTMTLNVTNGRKTIELGSTEDKERAFTLLGVQAPYPLKLESELTASELLEFDEMFIDFRNDNDDVVDIKRVAKTLAGTSWQFQIIFN
jgi:hypothetical protein